MAIQERPIFASPQQDAMQFRPIEVEVARRFSVIDGKLRQNIDSVISEKDSSYADSDEGFRQISSALQNASNEMQEVLDLCSKNPALIEGNAELDNSVFQSAAIWEFYRIIFLSDEQENVAPVLARWYHNYMFKWEIPELAEKRNKLVSIICSPSSSHDDLLDASESLGAILARCCLLLNSEFAIETLQIIEQLSPDVFVPLPNGFLHLLNVNASLMHLDTAIKTGNAYNHKKWLNTFKVACPSVPLDHPLSFFSVYVSKREEESKDEAERILRNISNDWLERFVIHTLWDADSSLLRALIDINKASINGEETEWTITPLLALLGRIRFSSVSKAALQRGVEFNESLQIFKKGIMSNEECVQLFGILQRELRSTLNDNIIYYHIVEMLSLTGDISNDSSFTQEFVGESLLQYADILLSQNDPLLRVHSLRYFMQAGSYIDKSIVFESNNLIDTFAPLVELQGTVTSDMLVLYSRICQAADTIIQSSIPSTLISQFVSFLDDILPPSVVAYYSSELLESSAKKTLYNTLSAWDKSVAHPTPAGTRKSIQGVINQNTEKLSFLSKDRKSLFDNGSVQMLSHPLSQPTLPVREVMDENVFPLLPLVNSSGMTSGNDPNDFYDHILNSPSNDLQEQTLEAILTALNRASNVTRHQGNKSFIMNRRYCIAFVHQLLDNTPPFILLKTLLDDACWSQIQKTAAQCDMANSGRIVFYKHLAECELAIVRNRNWILSSTDASVHAGAVGKEALGEVGDLDLLLSITQSLPSLLTSNLWTQRSFIRICHCLILLGRFAYPLYSLSIVRAVRVAFSHVSFDDLHLCPYHPGFAFANKEQWIELRQMVLSALSDIEIRCVLSQTV